MGDILKKKTIEILSYTAGIIDGEGSICIGRHKSKTNRSGYQIDLRVVVSNTNEWLCNWLQFQFDGSVHLSHRRSSPKQKPAYQWCVASKKAYLFLEQVSPYLQLKRQQAELAMTFQKRKFRGNQTDEQVALDEANKILMNSYNKRGL